MEWADLKTKSVKELRDMWTELQGELQSLNFQAHNRQLKQVHKIPQIRKTIARITMLLNTKKEVSSK